LSIFKQLKQFPTQQNFSNNKEYKFEGSSSLKRLRNDDSTNASQDMLETTSMILVQAFNQFGRNVPFTFFSEFIGKTNLSLYIKSLLQDTRNS